MFLNNVKNDILKPANLRTTKDNLTREERLALRSLKSSENVIRIQDKGSRFVVLSQQEYQNKILGQLNNDLHYDSIDSDPTLDHFEVVKEWSRKWFSERQISQEIATWVLIWNQNREWHLGMSKHTNVTTHFGLLHPVAAQQLNGFLPSQNSTSNLFHRVFHPL